jgi:outer membrane protein TolC
MRKTPFVLAALLAVAGAAVMLGGCNIYRPYSRPQMETAGLYRDTVSVTDTLSGDTVNFGNRPWQEVFTDPKLQSLIEQGLSSNIDLQTASPPCSARTAAARATSSMP